MSDSSSDTTAITNATGPNLVLGIYCQRWPNYPSQNVFNDRRNLLYGKSASFRCDGRLFHISGPAAADALGL